MLLQSTVPQGTAVLCAQPQQSSHEVTSTVRTPQAIAGFY